MCIAITSPIGIDVPDENILKRCWEANPHGAGFAFADGEKVTIKKGFMTWHHFITTFKEYNKKYDFKNKGTLIHFRIASHGAICPELTHPFPISGNDDDLRQTDFSCDYAIIHNGIISLTGSQARLEKKSSDTTVFIRDYIYPESKEKGWFTNQKIMQKLEDMAGSKLAYLDKDGNIKMTHGFNEFEGNFYSNYSYEEKSSKNFFSYWQDEDEEDEEPDMYHLDCDEEDFGNEYAIPLMSAKVGDTIEFTSGSELVMPGSEYNFYMSEDGGIYHRFEDEDGNEMFDYLGEGTIFDRQAQEVEFIPDKWVISLYAS